MNILLGMKILWIFSGVITKLGYIGSFLCILGSFLKDKVQNTTKAILFLNS